MVYLYLDRSSNNYYYSISWFFRNNKTSVHGGGYGPGAYYTPIMIQMILIGPVIYLVIKKMDGYGFLLCFAVTGCWETISYCVGISDYAYKLISFRYISLFSFGVYIAIGKKRLNMVLLATLFFAGIIWQTLLNYVPLHPLFMNYAWARVNLYSSLFVLPVMYFIIKKYGGVCIHVPLLQAFGKASFNIFLFQMLFYGCGPAQILYRFVNNEFLQLVLCVTCCLAFGYTFYIIETPITKKIVKSIKDFPVPTIISA